MTRWGVRIASILGGLCLLELLLETRLGLGSLTTGSPLAYRGVLVELPGTIWFLVLFGLDVAHDRCADGERRQRISMYTFAWTVVGLAAAIWSVKHANESNYHNWQYVVGFVCVGTAFVLVAIRDLGALRPTLRYLTRDAWAASRRRATWTIVVAAACLSAFGPRGRDVESRRVKPLFGQDLLDWFDMQPRRSLPVRYVGAPVVMATFTDYQCPACLAAEQDLGPIVDELSRQYGKEIRFVRLDFPLDGECNNGPTIHPAACEAAAVVRMARDAGHGPEMERWLWSNQKQLTRDVVFQGAKAVAAIDDAERRYPTVLEAVRKEAAMGYELGVRATPRYWINGVIVTRHLPAEIRRVLVHELERSRAERTK